MASRQVSKSRKVGSSKLNAADSPASSTTSSSKLYPETSVDSHSPPTSSSVRNKPQLHYTGKVPHNLRSKENVTVTVRFRPLSPREIRQGEEIAWYADGETVVRNEHNQSIAYAYDRVYLKDPFILPSQAKQVFYSREDESSNWYVVMRAPPRGYHELETEEVLGSAPLPVQEVDELDDEASDDERVYVRDDCEGLLVVE